MQLQEPRKAFEAFRDNYQVLLFNVMNANIL